MARWTTNLTRRILEIPKLTWRNKTHQKLLHMFVAMFWFTRPALSLASWASTAPRKIQGKRTSMHERKTMINPPKSRPPQKRSSSCTTYTSDTTRTRSINGTKVFEITETYQRPGTLLAS
jgi:hypothetical protein